MFLIIEGVDEIDIRAAKEDELKIAFPLMMSRQRGGWDIYYKFLTSRKNCR